jgi:hypothetical protein
MVEGNPQKPRMWLWVSQRKPRMMIDDDGGVEKYEDVIQELLMNHVQEKVS